MFGWVVGGNSGKKKREHLELELIIRAKKERKEEARSYLRD